MNNRRIESYRDLIVWQKAVDLVVSSYELTKLLPPTEKYGLTAQIQRAAVSVPANIAEGFGRKQLGEYIQHLSIANGSLKELETHFIVVVRLKLLGETIADPVLRQAEEIGKMLASLIQKLRSRRAQ